MFKKLIMLTAFFAASKLVCAELGRLVPQEVRLAFIQKYPDAKQVTWRDSLNYYCADFALGNTNFSAYFLSHGEWCNTTNTIAFTNVPLAVKFALATSKYSDWEKDNSVLQIVDAYRPISYRITATNVSSITGKYLFYTIDGEFIEERSAK